MDKKELMTYIGAPLVILIILAYIGNIALCTIIITSQRLRASIRNWLIFGLAVCDILTGVVMSLWVADLLNQLHHTCASMLLMSTFVTYTMPFLNFWYLVALNIDYCRRLAHKNLPQLSSLKKMLLYLGITLAPWLLMFVFVVPGMVAGMNDNVKEYWSSRFCPLVLSTVSALTLRGVACGIPILIIVVTSVVMISYYCQKQRVGTYANMATRLVDGNDADELEKPYCFIIPSLLTIVCVTPLEIFGLVAHNVGDYKVVILVASVLGLIVYSKAAILPFVWLILPDIRAEIKRKWFKRTEVGHAAYSRFPEQQESGEVTVTPKDEEQVDN